MPLFIRLLSLAAALCCGALPLAGQEVRPLTEPREFALDQWTTRDGLPQNSVTALAQTPDGYLWIGTFGGLTRFDGTSFSLVERADSSGRHVDRILALAVAPDSALWIGTERGVLRFQRGRYDDLSRPSGLTDEEVLAAHVDRAGAVWLGTASGRVVRYAGGVFQALRDERNEHLPAVIGFNEDTGGTLWINLSDRFVTLESGGRALSHARWRAPPVAGVINMLGQDRAGAMWFSRADGVVRMQPSAAQEFGSAAGLRRPVSMVEDPDDGFWLATSNDGAFYFHPAGSGTAQGYALPDGRTHYRVRVALVDTEGLVWFGTDADGLLRARRNLFTTYTSAQGLSHDVATAVYADAAGVVWVGTNCFGLNGLDLVGRTVRVFKPRRSGDPDGDPCVFSLTESPRGVLWAGTWGGGLTRIAGGRETRLRHGTGLRDSVVLSLFTDRDGTLWAGTHSGGLAALRDGKVVAAYTTADGLAHNSVRVIMQARDGALWIGTLGGLSRLQDGRLRTYKAADGLSAEHVRSIYEDADGNLWIGTYGGGLNRWRDDAFAAVTQRDGLAEDVVSTIFADRYDRFWFSGNRGVSRVARADLLAFTEGRARSVHAVLYREPDGLLNAETNGGFQPAGWQDAAGRLWFPTVQGVAMVDPARVATRERAPAVVIEAVVVDGVARPATDLVAGPDRPNLEFRYAGLSLSGPQHLAYRYRLEGFDPDWVDAGGRRVAYYPRLASGRYRFMVTAANRDGIWNATGAALALRVVPPLWNAPWFRAALVAAGLGLAVVLVRRREAAARRRRAAHEEFSRQLIASQEHERKRIAAELHDSLGQDLLVVKNRALLALKADGLQPPARDQLRQIDEIATRSLEAVRDLAHHLTPYQLDHLGLSAALRSMIAAAANSADLALDVNVEPVDGLLALEHQINLYRIVQEAVSNVVRHAGARTAAVHVRRVADSVVATIRDDGRGFALPRDAAGRLALGFGMSGMAERARILGGHIEVLSTPGSGTHIEVTAPVVPAQGEARVS